MCTCECMHACASSASISRGCRQASTQVAVSVHARMHADVFACISMCLRRHTTSLHRMPLRPSNLPRHTAAYVAACRITSSAPGHRRGHRAPRSRARRAWQYCLELRRSHHPKRGCHVDSMRLAASNQIFPRMLAATLAAPVASVCVRAQITRSEQGEGARASTYLCTATSTVKLPPLVSDAHTPANNLSHLLLRAMHSRRELVLKAYSAPISLPCFQPHRSPLMTFSSLCVSTIAHICPCIHAWIKS